MKYGVSCNALIHDVINFTSAQTMFSSHLLSLFMSTYEVEHGVSTLPDDRGANFRAKNIKIFLFIN